VVTCVCYQWSHSVEVWAYKPSKTTIKRWHSFGYEKDWGDKPTVHNQNTEDDLKILLRIQSTFTITILSLIHLRDLAVYVWTTLDTIRISCGTGCQVIRRFAYSIGRSTFNPHLPSRFSFLSTREYRLSGVEVSEYRRTTIRAEGRRVAVRRGSLVYLYLGDGLWRWFDFGRSWSSESWGWVFG